MKQFLFAVLILKFSFGQSQEYFPENVGVEIHDNECMAFTETLIVFRPGDISLETHQTELWKCYMGKYEVQAR